MPAPFVHELRVRYGECDPQGIVFNANYLLYFDVAFTEFWRQAVGPWQELVDRGTDAVVAEANLRFRGPARFDDVLGVRVEIAELGATDMRSDIAVSRGQETLVTGRLRHVFLDATTWRKTEIPEWVAGRLRHLVTAGGSTGGDDLAQAVDRSAGSASDPAA